jgi:predicted enzyme related to lactoylglutathione lyase
MNDLQGNWIWYELLADDPHAAKTFYEAVVGWSITLDAMPMSEPDTAYAMITAEDGPMVGGMLTITAEMKAQGARSMWLGYVSVEDCAATLAAIEKRGGRVLMPATTLDVGTMAMVMDPWGAPFYIMAPTPRPDGAKSTAFSPTQTGRCGWNELHTSDQAGAVGFYTELFGWSLPGSMDMGDFGTYQFIGKGEVMLGAIMTSPPQSPPPHWNHYFRVVSIPAARPLSRRMAVRWCMGRWRYRAATGFWSASILRARLSRWSAARMWWRIKSHGRLHLLHQPHVARPDRALGAA